jgi:hypothetical protein
LATATNIPRAFTQGESVAWTRLFPNYPSSDGWSIVYNIRGPVALDITCVPDLVDGTAYTATVTPATSETLTAGSYWWQVFALQIEDIPDPEEDGPTELVVERELLESGMLTVTPSLAKVSGTYDGRSYARTVLDAIESVIQGKASQDQLNVTIGPTTVGRLTPDQIEKWRAIYRQEVNAEEVADRIARGEDVSRLIRMRFTR